MKSTRSKPMLRLQSHSSTQWLDRVLDDLDTLLLDHAHCEKKAASTALGLIFKYPEHSHFARPLSAVAREELEHFELVLSHIESRGGVFKRLSPSPYAGRLLSAVRPDEPRRLVDTLLCCALIEARSCERMTLLAKFLNDEALQNLYRGLLKSEARHHMLYVDLAKTLCAAQDVMTRLETLAAFEASILLEAPPVPRMHN